MIKNVDDKKNELEQKIEELETKNDELTNNWKRALADYQNLEKRMVQDRHDAVKYANQKILHELLVCIDDIENAEKHIKDQGLHLAVGGFQAILKGNGVQKIDVIGKKFDPQVMECIKVVQNEEDGIVIEEVRPGYTFYDKVLRPAQVKVGKKII